MKKKNRTIFWALSLCFLISLLGMPKAHTMTGPLRIPQDTLKTRNQDTVKTLAQDSLKIAQDTLKTTQDTLNLTPPDSLTALYLDIRHLPYSQADRVPFLDSAMNRVADDDGFFYKLDSLGLEIVDEKGKRTIDSLMSFSPLSLQKMAFLDSLQLPHSDTIRIPLRDTSGTMVKDTLGFLYITDSLGLIQLDSLGSFMIDSLRTFTPKEMKQFARWNRRDARILADSLRKSTFQTLETYVFGDSLKYKRVVTWTNDSYFNDLKFKQVDTSLNDHFHDYAYLKEDVGATYLGTAGSPTLTDNYFKRKTKERFHFWDVGMTEAYDVESIPHYNTKSAYTVMSYAGTLFSNKEIEESNVFFLHTQNLSPQTNIQFYYQRKGANGLLDREATNTRTLHLGANHLGKRYIMHAGWLTNSIRREENGGVAGDYWILDTLIEARAVATNLSEASSTLRSRTLYINQSLGIPIKIFKSDTLGTGTGTMMYLGHSGQWSILSRIYEDAIALTSSQERDFYQNQFYINPTKTRDSIRTSLLDNRFFLRLQPWAATAIVSKLEGGLGYEMLGNYCFNPSFYTHGLSNKKQNNLYFYAGASGSLSKYFQWNALGRMDYIGYYAGDMMLDANVRFSVYPNPQGVHLSGRFYFKNYTPEWYLQDFYTNHYVWQNDFGKVTDTRLEAKLSIPDWKMEASFSYGLLNNGIYYDTLSVVRQAPEAVNIMTATLTKNFKLWYFHLDHRVLFQLSSNQELFPLPLVSANLRYYLEFPVVKNVLTAQLGADATFHTAYYVQAYNPALGVFHLQNDREYGQTPYLDAFVNLKWKRATIFVKYINAIQGTPTSDYFSAAHYIRPQRVIKLGMTWPFYLSPASYSSSSKGGGSSSGPASGPGGATRNNTR